MPLSTTSQLIKGHHHAPRVLPSFLQPPVHDLLLEDLHAPDVVEGRVLGEGQLHRAGPVAVPSFLILLVVAAAVRAPAMRREDREPVGARAIVQIAVGVGGRSLPLILAHLLLGRSGGRGGSGALPANDALRAAVFPERNPLEFQSRVVRQCVHYEAAHLAHDGEAEVVVAERVDVQRKEVRKAG